MKTLSVVVVNFNHAIYLRECLDAILTQSWRPLEVIIVDDASTDNSCDIVKQYQQHHSHVTLIVLEQNSGGPQKPLQIGLQRAKGDYVALCAADDIVQPGFFEQTMACLTKHPELGLCSTDFTVFPDQKPYVFEQISLSPSKIDQIFYPEQLVQVCAQSIFVIPSQTTIYKRDLVLQYGSYDASLKSIGDFYLNYQIALRHPVAHIPLPLGAYRMVSASYGRRFRFNFRQRSRLYLTLLDKIRKEDSLFQERLKKSGILGQTGLFMVLHLLFYPSFWKYFPPALKKWWIRVKFQRERRSRQKGQKNSC